MTTAPAVVSPDESVHVQPGDVLGERYRLDRRVGRGGMAEVFAGTDTRLDRPVAVKVVAAHLGDDTAAARRFEREILAVAQVQHPNVVAVFDADVDHDQPYLVTELLEGGTLADRIRNGPLAPGEAAAIGAHVAAGLEAAHAQGLIHRDVKPANVLLTVDGVAKVTDFGIVQALDRTATLTSSVHGSTPYVAPEQIRGDDATPSTDVYALGCVLHEMLTGRPPFVSDAPVGVISQHLDGEVPRVADHRPGDLPVVDAALADLVARCLAKRPDDRPTSMSQLRAGLERAGAGAPVPTQRLGDATTVLLPDGDGGQPAPTQGDEATALLPDDETAFAAPRPQAPLPPTAVVDEPTGVAVPPDDAGSRTGRRMAAILAAVVVLLVLLWAVASRGPSTPEVTPLADGATATPVATPVATPEQAPEPEEEPVAAAITELRDHLEAGRAGGLINAGEAQKLAKELDDIEKKHGEDKRGEAIDKATDLQEKVDELREKDRIDPAFADQLDDDLDALLQALVLEDD